VTDPRVCRMADGLVGSEILRIAGEIRALTEQGAEICNLTVGDFSPAQFRAPAALVDGIVEALRAGETNYPPSEGMLPLRKAVAALFARRFGLDYPLESVLVTAGSRPGLYVAYRALVDEGDAVVYTVPSWNNQHYVHLLGARGVPVACPAEDAFLPTRERLEGVVRGARLLVLNSPLNPSGTTFTAEALGDICDLVLEENARRAPGERPLYLLYDQVYWTLTFGDTAHVNPVSLRPEMRAFTVFVDGISKSFAATGVRVGWTVGPADVTARMASILGHVGAWAPRAEQVATARLLSDDDAMARHQESMGQAVHARLAALYGRLEELRAAGYAVEPVAPMGAIYLSVRFPLHGARTPEGTVLETNEDVRRYLLEAAGMAVVPFQAFGLTEESGWFRLSVGAVGLDEIEPTMERLERALTALRDVPSPAPPPAAFAAAS
jgi:aspartate aminotransferase